MKTNQLIEGYLARFPLGAAICYVAVVIAFLLTTSLYIIDFLERREAVAATGDILSQLEGRSPSPSRNADADGISFVTGSPVLEGPTVTVAGATLLQRVGWSGNTFRWQHFIFPSRFARRTIKRWICQSFSRL